MNQAILGDWAAEPTYIRGAHPQLDWYQQEAVDSVFEEFKENDSTLCVMATGLGKTMCFSAVAEAFDGNVLVLAHRDELVHQARERLELFLGEPVDVEQRDSRSTSRARVVVGSVQSVTRENRLQRLGRDRFQLVILDEVHHAPAVTFRRILEFFGDAKRLGVTATPDRADEKALGKLFQSVAYCMDISEGIEAGYLVPIRGTRVELGAIDISGVAVSGGDLVAGQLDVAMLRATEGIVKAVLEHEPDRQGIGFFPGVKSAEFATDRMNALRPGSAALVTAKTPLDERREIMQRFKRGELQYLFNVGVATEGFDAPTASLVIMGRPTKSRSLYAQMAGRGGRVLAETRESFSEWFSGKEDANCRRQAIALSNKPDMVILDFVGNSGRHSLVGPEDLLGGNYTDAEIDEAKKRTSPGGDIAAALAKARLELQRIAGEIASKVETRKSEFNPFGLLRIGHRKEDVMDERFGGVPASDPQRKYLMGQGVAPEDLEGLSKRAASKLIGSLKKRREIGLAGFAQMRALKRLGVSPPATVSAVAAANAIEYLHSNKHPDHDLLLGILRGERAPGMEG